jgi:hypothetical protein
MYRLSPAVVLLLASAATSLASIPVNTEAVQRSIVFLYAENNDRVDERRQVGTGFLVLVPSKGNPQMGALLLITARHILDHDWGFCSGANPKRIYMRLNRASYDPNKEANGVQYEPVTLVEDGRSRYWVSSDDKVDAAIVLLEGRHYSESKLEINPINLSDFAAPDEIKNLAVGDSVLSAGLIPGKSGEKRNYPFFKFGNISSKPDEPTWINCETGMPELRLERVWFIAANLVPGNSGSPVFTYPLGTAGMSLGGGRVMLIGVQSSSFGGADIAGMTPIADVFEIISKNLPEADLYRGDPRQKPN